MNEKIIREKTVCFTGHRSEKLPGGDALERLRKRLALEIERALHDGYDTFLFGGAYGFDLMAAEEVLKKKVLIDLQNPRYIRLIAVIPFEEQAVRFSVSDHERYFNLVFFHIQTPSLWQIASWVLLLAVNSHFKMQMIAGAAAGGAHLGNDRSGIHRLSLGDENFGAVGVQCDEAATMIHHHME